MRWTRVPEFEQIRELTKRLQQAGIQVGYFLQFGYPGETREDIEKTIQLIRDGNPDDIGISVSYPMPGTKFFEAVHEQLGQKQNWQDSNDLAMLYHGEFSTGFYRKLHSVVHKEFRARKAWQALKQRLGWRYAARLGYNLMTLPIARKQLAALAVTQPVSLVIPHMDHKSAATPTPQDKR